MEVAAQMVWCMGDCATTIGISSRCLAYDTAVIFLCAYAGTASFLFVQFMYLESAIVVA